MRAVELEPENLDHWLDLGLCLRHLGDPLGQELLFDYGLFMRGYLRLQVQSLSPAWRKLIPREALHAL
jgi:hypothetical protein